MKTSCLVRAYLYTRKREGPYSTFLKLSEHFYSRHHECLHLLSKNSDSSLFCNSLALELSILSELKNSPNSETWVII